MKVSELMELLKKAAPEAEVLVTSNTRTVQVNPACAYDVAQAELVEDDVEDKNGPWICLTIRGGA